MGKHDKKQLWLWLNGVFCCIRSQLCSKIFAFQKFCFQRLNWKLFFHQKQISIWLFSASAWMSARLNLIPDRFPSGIWVSSFFHQNLDEIFFQNLVEKSTGFTSDKDDKRTEASSRAISFMIILREAANPCSAECLKLWCLVWFAPSHSIFS